MFHKTAGLMTILAAAAGLAAPAMARERVVEINRAPAIARVEIRPVARPVVHPVLRREVAVRRVFTPMAPNCR